MIVIYYRYIRVCKMIHALQEELDQEQAAYDATPWWNLPRLCDIEWKLKCIRSRIQWYTNSLEGYWRR